MDGEIVPNDVSKKDLRDEVNFRTNKAGYTTREGKPVPLRIMAACNWGATRLNVWPRDANGNLIE